MTEVFEPGSAEEARAIVAEALASKTPLEVRGTGSKCALGRPVETDCAISTAALSGVSLYEPEELVMRAGPGTPMAQLRLQLDQHGQMLAFEPPDLGPLLGGAAEEGTIGGIVAGNLSGPRRIKAGAARDHFLGVEAVSGRGEIFKSGGRVVKNVTGYDLCKLMCGAWGTLAVMTEVTLKVLPAPEKTRTVLIACDDPAEAVRAMTAGLSSPNDVSGAAWLPAEVARESAVSYVSGAGTGLVALRVEGIGVSVDARCAALREAGSGFGAVEELHTHNSLALWRALRDVLAFAETGGTVWKLSVPPASAPGVIAGIRDAVDCRFYADWGGGLLWVETDGAEDAGAGVIRAAAGGFGGHATLVRAAADLRARIGAFHPEAPGVATLARNVKQGFDPENILNPGRMYPSVAVDA
jgi:glycolate oxidase FAD binding subunit